MKLNYRFRTGFSALCLLASGGLLGSIAGCFTEPDPPRGAGLPELPETGPIDLPDATTSPEASPGIGRIEGRILNANQREIGVIPRAKISVLGGPSTESDGAGFFQLEGVPAGRTVLLTVTKGSLVRRINNQRETPALSTGQIAIEVKANETTQVFPRLFEGCTGVVRLQQGDAGASVDVDFNAACQASLGQTLPFTFASVSLPVGGIVKEDGSPFSGSAKVSVIPLPLDRLAGSSFAPALPGASVGVTKANQPVAVETFGAVELRLTDAADAPLRLGPNQTAKVRVAVHSALSADHAAWSYDFARGLWVERVVGAYDPAFVSPSRTTLKVYTFDVPELGWWSVDKSEPALSCVRGRARIAGAAAAGADLRAVGSSFGGATGGRADSAGAFCLNVKQVPASGKNLEALTIGADSLLTGRRFRLTKGVPDGMPAGNCETQPTACVDLGDLELASEEIDCASIRAKFQSGNAIVPYPRRLELFAREPTVPNESYGFSSDSYLGEIPPSSPAVCRPVPRASGFAVSDPEDPNCSFGKTISSFRPRTVPGGPAPLCPAAETGEAGTPVGPCLDPGDLFLFCSS